MNRYQIEIARLQSELDRMQRRVKELEEDLKLNASERRLKMDKCKRCGKCCLVNAYGLCPDCYNQWMEMFDKEVD